MSGTISELAKWYTPVRHLSGDENEFEREDLWVHLESEMKQFGVENGKVCVRTPRWVAMYSYNSEHNVWYIEAVPVGLRVDHVAFWVNPHSIAHFGLQLRQHCQVLAKQGQKWNEVVRPFAEVWTGCSL